MCSTYENQPLFSAIATRCWKVFLGDLWTDQLESSPPPIALKCIVTVRHGGISLLTPLKRASTSALIIKQVLVGSVIYINGKKHQRKAIVRNWGLAKKAVHFRMKCRRNRCLNIMHNNIGFPCQLFYEKALWGRDGCTVSADHIDFKRIGFPFEKYPGNFGDVVMGDV